MDAFEYNANPGRVVFGSGTIQKLPDEISRLNLKNPLVLSTPQQTNQAERVQSVLNGQIAGIFSNATMHTPTHVTDDAVQHAQEKGADSVISIGGGSTIGLGKAISFRTGMPHICIPTTYAGSEMTPILGETADGVKKTKSDKSILPGTVIYDVDLTMSLPTGMSATSGVNAIAHAGNLPLYTTLVALIPVGGQVVKVWNEAVGAGGLDDVQLGEKHMMGSDSEDSDKDSDDDSDREGGRGQGDKSRRKRKKAKGKDRKGGQQIMAFEGMD